MGLSRPGVRLKYVSNSRNTGLTEASRR